MAFWEYPDWSGGTQMRSGAQPFWMLPELHQPEPQFSGFERLSYKMDEMLNSVSLRPTYGMTCPRCGRLPTTWGMDFDHTKPRRAGCHTCGIQWIAPPVG